LRDYSIRTEESYVDWIRHYILFHDKRHPQDMGRAEVEAFLTHLAVEGNFAASTQNQAFSALLFLYREVHKIELDAPLDAVRAKKPARLPVVLTRAEAQQVIEGMTGTYQLMAKLLYGSGLRLMECVRLRVKLLHDQDLAAGLGQVYLPCALDRKYPNASHEWSKRQYVFPSDRLSTDPRTGIRRRHTCTCAASAGVTWTKATCSVPSKLVLSETKGHRAPGPSRQAR